MALVGKTMLEETSQELPCIGIATYGVIYGREKLKGSRGKVIAYQPSNSSDESGVPASQVNLDPNHSHFLLADDGSEGEFGREIELRAELEDVLCGGMADRADASAKGQPKMENASMVTLLVDGGPFSLETTLATLRKSRPVVVLRDSGRAASVLAVGNQLLAQTVQEFEKKRPLSQSELRSAIERELRRPNAGIFQELSEASLDILEKKQDTVIDVLLEGAKTREGTDHPLLSSFKLEDDTDEVGNQLDVVIMEAILSGCADAFKRVELAVKWGEVEIISRQLEMIKSRDRRKLGQIFETALQTANVVVVQLLIEFGSTPKRMRFDEAFESLFLEELDRYDLYSSLLDREREMRERNLKRRNESQSEKLGLAACFLFRLCWDGRQSAKVEQERDDIAVARKTLEKYIPEYERHITRREEMLAAPPQQPGKPPGKVVRAKTSASLMTVATATHETMGTHVARTRVAPAELRPTWTDLMMWAAIIGRQDLARLFWGQSPQPLRDALMASQMCRKIAVEKADADELPLREAATAYENWAIGLMDQIADRKDAVRILCSRNDGWNYSAIELAIFGNEGLDDQENCLNFVAHRHCQHVLENYLYGDYYGSRAALPRKDTSLLNICLQMIAPFLPGAFVKLRGVHFLGEGDEENERDAAGRADDDSDDNLSEYDDDFFENPAKEISDAGKKLVQQSSLVLQMYHIPYVKFCFHTAFYLGYLAAIVLVIQSVNIFTGELPLNMGIPELIFHITTITRCIEELGQMYTSGWSKYIASIWNVLDLAAIFLSLIVLALRLLTVESVLDYHIESAAQRGLVSAHTAYEGLLPLTRTLLAVVVCCVGFRMLDIFTFSRNLGVYKIILIKMLVDDVSAFLWIFAVLSLVSFGLAFQVLLPGLRHSGDYWSLPVLMPIFGIFGDFDVSVFTDYLAPEYSTDRAWISILNNVVGVLMLLFSLLMSTIVLVNLLIAQMSDTYSEIKASSLQQWQFDRIHLILEFKDERGPLPPPLNIIWTIFFDLLYMRVWRKCCIKPSFDQQSTRERTTPGINMPIDTESQAKVVQARDEFLRQDREREKESMEHKVAVLHREHKLLRDEHNQTQEMLAGRSAAIIERLSRLETILNPNGELSTTPMPGSLARTGRKKPPQTPKRIETRPHGGTESPHGIIVPSAPNQVLLEPLSLAQHGMHGVGARVGSVPQHTSVCSPPGAALRPSAHPAICQLAPLPPIPVPRRPPAPPGGPLRFADSPSLPGTTAYRM